MKSALKQQDRCREYDIGKNQPLPSKVLMYPYKNANINKGGSLKL